MIKECYVYWKTPANRMKHRNFPDNEVKVKITSKYVKFFRRDDVFSCYTYPALKDMKLDGKLLRKNGTIETEYTTYPKWRDVIPNPEMTKMESVELDFGKIREFEKDYKAGCKARGYKDAPAYIRVADKYTFNLTLLVKMAKFMEHTGTRELLLDPNGRRAALVIAGESRGILMPCYDPDIKGEFVYELY